MSSQQQEWIALAAVILIAGISIFRWWQRRKRGDSGCSHCEKSCSSPETTSRKLD
ncbi:MAG: FeoB-associated Cys-rich membrane protein [Gammaproteobacteria bacterium]|nr:FeoB-associated Cys-rich membrane protein [Gammaproteobacteria bacterium]MBQ0839355.1 FeoB-associated Cys-rich membrane protein [Gammaproteobacteria bacterium]